MPFTSRKQFFYLLYNEPEVFMEWVEDYGVPKEFKVGSTEHWLMQIKKMDPKRSMSRMKKKMLRGAESFGAEDMITITGIDWETDGEDVDLPTSMEVPADLESDEIADYLSDQMGWLVNGFVMGAESFEADGISKVSHLWKLSFDFNEREISWYDEILPMLKYYKTSSNYPLESYNFNFFEDSEGDWITVEAFSRSKVVLEKLKLDLDDELEGYIHYDAESFEAEDKEYLFVRYDVRDGEREYSTYAILDNSYFNSSNADLIEWMYGDVGHEERAGVYWVYGEMLVSVGNRNRMSENLKTQFNNLGLNAENWGGDPEGPLAKALERARKKSRHPKRPLKIERLDAEQRIHEDTLTNKEIKTNVVYPLLLGILGGTIATVVGNLWSIEIAKKRGHL